MTNEEDDDAESQWDTGSQGIYQEFDVQEIHEANKRYAQRFETLLVELHMLEAKSVRLSQSFEAAPSETAQDALVATQMAITSKRSALKNIRAAVEANCNNLNEDMLLYIPYTDDA